MHQYKRQFICADTWKRKGAAVRETSSCTRHTYRYPSKNLHLVATEPSKRCSPQNDLRQITARMEIIYHGCSTKLLKVKSRQRLLSKLLMAFVFLSSWQLCQSKFNYEEYVRIQTDGNRRKIARQFVDTGTIEAIAKWMKNEMKVEGVVHGICHGTRRGFEQRIFRELVPNSNVFGTEISDTATNFEHTIQWDYHLKKLEWEGHFDFIYSNTLDHSYDPQLAIDVWMSTLNRRGELFLEWTKAHSESGVSRLDPFGASLGEYIKLFHKFKVCDLLTLSRRHIGAVFIIVAGHSCGHD